MKADITRRTFKADKHYSRTIQQQGRVPMDADWNEQVDIQAWRDTREGTDVIGLAGTPKAPMEMRPAAAFNWRRSPASATTCAFFPAACGWRDDCARTTPRRWP